jgi:hypothetical protein
MAPHLTNQSRRRRRAGTTSGRSAVAGPTLMGFNAIWSMALVWLLVIVVALSPFPWW